MTILDTTQGEQDRKGNPGSEALEGMVGEKPGPGRAFVPAQGDARPPPPTVSTCLPHPTCSTSCPFLSCNR